MNSCTPLRVLRDTVTQRYTAVTNPGASAALNPLIRPFKGATVPFIVTSIISTKSGATALYSFWRTTEVPHDLQEPRNTGVIFSCALGAVLYTLWPRSPQHAAANPGRQF